MGIIITVLILGAAIIVHELGHLIAMKRNGVSVLEYGIGFGPQLMSYQPSGSETLYVLRALPFGGYVKPQAEGPRSMQEAIPWVKFKIAFAGPFANMVLSFLVLLVLSFFGDYTNVRHEWLQPFPTWLRPFVWSVGLSFGLALLTPPLFAYATVTNGSALLSRMAGPIGIVQIGSGTVESGEPTVASLVIGIAFTVWLINVAIAGCNLLPLYPFDGGHCLLAIVERFVNHRFKFIRRWFIAITFPLFIILVLIAFSSDILRLLGVVKPLPIIR